MMVFSSHKIITPAFFESRIFFASGMYEHAHQPEARQIAILNTSTICSNFATFFGQRTVLSIWVHETPFVEKDQVVGRTSHNHHDTGRWIHETPFVRIDQVIGRTSTNHHVTGTFIAMTKTDP